MIKKKWWIKLLKIVRAWRSEGTQEKRKRKDANKSMSKQQQNIHTINITLPFPNHSPPKNRSVLSITTLQ